MKIISHSALTGQVGSVVFASGVGITEDEAMLAYFGERPDEYDVLESDPEPEPEEPADPDAKPEPAPLTDADYDALSDAQVAEAYSIRVPDGNATSRRGQVKVMRALDQLQD